VAGYSFLGCLTTLERMLLPHLLKELLDWEWDTTLGVGMSADGASERFS
jgi:hypothetical protein